MQITKEQMEVFSKEGLKEFEERIGDFIQTEFPDGEDIPREELMSAIHEQVVNARSYGLETERQIANYATTAWLLGQQFDTEFPAAKDVLTSLEYSSEDKSEWLAQWTESMFTTLDEDS